MNLSQLEYFICIADTQSFTKAAELMHITQPAITNAINKLVEEIGVPLFVKEGRNVRLSPYGETFSHYIRQSNLLINEGVKSIQEQYRYENNRVSLAMIKEMDMQKLAPFIIAFKDKHPDIKLELKEMGYNDIINGLNKQILSLGLCGLRESDLTKNELESQPLVKYQTYAFINKHHPFAERESLQNADLINDTVFYISQDALDAVKKAMPELNINDSNSAVCTNLCLCKQIVAQNRGIFLKMCVEGEQSGNDNIVMVPLAGTNINLGLIWHKNKQLSNAEKLFLKHIKECVNA